MGEFSIWGTRHGAFEWWAVDFCPKDKDGGRVRLEVRNLAGEWFSYKAGTRANEGVGIEQIGGIDRYRFSWRGAKTESFEFGKKYPDECLGYKNHPDKIPCLDKPQDWLPG